LKIPVVKNIKEKDRFLFNNAANNPKIEASKEDNFSRIGNFPLEIWEEDLSVGLTGAFLCAKYFGPEINLLV